MSTSDSEGPAWNKFWLSLDHETESMVSGEGSHRAQTPGRSLMSPEASRPPGLERGDSVLPNDSASHHGEESPFEEAERSPVAPEDAPFPFKFKAPSGRVHKIHVVASTGMAELISSVTLKLGGEVDVVGGAASFEDGKVGSMGYALSYLDNEGDTVSMTTDQDLSDAIVLAQRSHRDKVDLFVHDPQKPPMTATIDPRPALSKPLTPPESEVRERRRQVAEDADDETMDVPVRKDRRQATAQPKQEDLIAGVPNDLLLPGAIVTLAVVIVGVFAISRASSR